MGQLTRSVSVTSGHSATYTVYGVEITEREDDIMSMGVDGYLKYLDDSYKAGDITIMQKKTGRAFAREWDRNSCKFRQVADNEELEFKEKLSTLLKEATES